MTSAHRAWRPIALRTAALVAMLAAVFAVALAARPYTPSPAEVQAAAGDAGWWIWFVAIPVLALFRFSMLPSSVATATAGLVLGPAAGASAAVVAAVFVACAQLVIGRHVLGAPVREELERRAASSMRFVRRHGWVAVLLVRLLPLPHGPFSYAAGGTRLSIRHMALGTLVGATPMAIAYATIGGNLHDPVSVEVAVSVAVVMAVGAGGALLARRLHLQHAPAPPRSASIEPAAGDR